MPDLPRPEVVVHNSISVDGATTGFLPHLGQHYGVAVGLGAAGRLVGSMTMRSGLDHAGESPAPDPGPQADRPPIGREDAEYWFLVDSAAHLHGRLHELRAFPGLRDVVVLVSHATPKEYLDYLTDRDYRWFAAGPDHVMLAEALPWIRAEYRITRLIVDSGPVLTHILLDHGLVDEVSLLVHPVAVGESGRRLFEGSEIVQRLDLLASRALEYGVMHLHYRVLGPESG